MKRVALALGAIVVALYLVALLVPVDPEERRPETRLSGSVAEAPSDWGERIEPRMQVYVQTNTWYGIPHSVTTVSFALDGDLFIPCARCGTKRWPRNVARDPEVVVKVGDALYERKAVRVDDPNVLQRVFGERLHQVDDLWLFRMDPRD